MTLYFGSNRSGGKGGFDLYQATRPTVIDAFGDVMNMSGINSAFNDEAPHISADGATIYFDSDRPGNEGAIDLYLATRQDLSDPFANVTNLGAGINGPTSEIEASESSNRLFMFFSDFQSPFRPGGQGASDIWIAVRNSTEEQFGDVVNLDSFGLGSDVNSSFVDFGPSISSDWPAFGSQLYFASSRPGGSGGRDIWQAIWVSALAGDYNNGGTVEQADLDLVLLHWGADASAVPDSWTNDLAVEFVLVYAFGTPVPEPRGAILGLLAAIVVLMSTRRKLDAAMLVRVRPSMRISLFSPLV